MKATGKSRATIIVAGGAGFRMGTTIPKQFLLLAGEPVLAHTLRTFHHFDSTMRIILVLPKEHLDLWRELVKQVDLQVDFDLVAGGEERFFSVRNAIENLGDEDLVAIHDGVRPLVSQSTIQRTFESAEMHGAAVPVVAVVDSLRQVFDHSNQQVDRTSFVRVQTPQCFRADWLRKAYQQPFSKSFTDDASVVEKLGHRIHLVEGNNENLKITGPEDLRIADAYMAK